MSSSTAPAPTPVLPPPILTQEEANSSSPTMSSQSQTSPSMPSSSSSQARHAHGVSDNWSQLSQPPLSASELKKLNEISERQIAEARAFLEASMSNIGSSLDKTLQERARNLHENSKVLARQEKDLGKATEVLRKENDKLGKMANEGSKKIKELGNVQNWAEMLERDFLVLGEYVRLVDGGSESESSWTESEDGGEEDARRHGHARDEAYDIPGHASKVQNSSTQPSAGDVMTLDTTEEHASEGSIVPGNGKLAAVDADDDAEMWNTPQETRQDKADSQ